MHWSTDDRQQLWSFLNVVERIAITFYRLLLWFVIGAVATVVTLVVIYRPWGDGSQGEWFYFSIAVLLVLGWAIGQFTMLRRRANTPWPGIGASTFRSKGPGRWEFRFGSPAHSTEQSPSPTDEAAWQAISESFNIPLTTLEIAQPSDEVLARLRQELNRGLSLDQACRNTEPAFANWSGIEQHAYLLYVQELLTSAAI